MKIRTYFAEYSGFDWPNPRDLERYFRDPRGNAWPREGGNDTGDCGLKVWTVPMLFPTRTTKYLSV